jgi:2-keto-4-pentenoate hydratase/2-oxohepta-3-ene-1,7-dioic acid hydratase in catechol pathway
VKALRKIYRVEFHGEEFYALGDGDRVRRVEGSIFNGCAATGPEIAMDEVRLLCPARPSKIIGVGFNYRDPGSSGERPIPKEPLLFLKPPTTLLEPHGVIRWPALSQRVEFEGELAVVIGREAKDVPQDRALDYVLGVTCMNDVTARDLQAIDAQLTRPKGFDTFGPAGPCIACGLDPNRLSIRTLVNGEVRQSSTTAHLIFDVKTLIAYISRVMTLVPGDVITTGTPPGSGPLRPGDRIRVEIEGVGTLENTIEACIC